MNTNFPKLEEEILKFWRENMVFEKSISQRKNARDFIFYEGPPTANGRPGIHHVLARAFKDVICRYKTMRGFRVLRKAGWDTHGLPVEIEVERSLGLKSKSDIEKYGIARFNEKCRKSVWAYKEEWEKLTERIGYWLDMKNPYITYEPDYIETLWFIIKNIWEKGFLYQDYKVLPYCPRCGTAISSHEVALGYKKIKEPAIYVKFKVQNSKTYLLIWTTTPWTLPGNVAVAVNPKITYVEVKSGSDILILAKERLGALEGSDLIIKKEFPGKDLLGLKYEPPYPAKLDKRAYFVIEGSFVSTEEGTGLVHIAPAFGEEDMAVGKENNLPVLMTVDESGKFKKEVKNWQGMFIKDADPLIIKDLQERGLLFKEELYEHDYPFCWRCDSPLLYYAKKSWFIKMSKVKKDLLANNRKINWIPKYLKEGRFGEWLREVKDWAFSRERYWGTPLPVWRCQNCSNTIVIGSKEELRRQKFTTNQLFILRHGKALSNQKNIVSCWPEKFPNHLSKEGKLQVEKIAKKLKGKIDLIFASDLLRTKETAEIIAKTTGIKPEYDQRLREFNVGLLNSKPIEEMGRFWDPEGKLSKEDYYLRRFKIRPPGGENWTDLKMRVYQFIKEINKRYQGKRILIISHESPLTMLEGAVKGLSSREIIQYRLKNKIELSQLRKLDFKIWPYNSRGELDFHRPYVDEIEFYCQRCKSLMKRVPDLVDVWFDSGAMPFGQAHWPFARPQKSKVKSQKLMPPELFPADYIAEAVDQTRGWFYTLLAVSTLLGFGSPYKNVISLGHVLDEKGEKMSKSKGNVVDPWLMVEKYGADAVRWYFYTVNQPGDSKLFSEKDLDRALKKFIMIFWNSLVFYNTYAIKKLSFGRRMSKYLAKSLLDRWIISKVNLLIKNVTKYLDQYDITSAAREIENFVVEDLSHWYIRRSRRLIQEQKSSEVLAYILLQLALLSAPFIPFLSERVYKSLMKKPSSVHLFNWPEVNIKLIDNKLNKQMEEVRRIVGLGLEARMKAGIKVRQPLALLKIQNPKSEIRNNKELLKLVKDELNIKEVIFDPKLKQEVWLDTKITQDLREEGIVREVVRRIQAMRKKGGYKPWHKIIVQYHGDGGLNDILAKNKLVILKETRAEDFLFGPKLENLFDVESETRVDNKKLWLGIKRL